MKFRWKLMIITWMLLAFLFGIGGSMLIGMSCQNMLEQEKRAAKDSYEMMLHTIETVSQMEDGYQNQTVESMLQQLDAQGVLNECSVRLVREEGEGKINWKYPLFFRGKKEQFYSNRKEWVDKTGKSCIYEKKHRQYYQISSPILYGSKRLILQGVYDISSVYRARKEQVLSFYRVFLCIMFLGGILSYYMAFVLTDPLRRLSVVSKQISKGNLSIRADVKAEDEIGELAGDFNEMTHQLVEKINQEKEMLKSQEEFMGSFAHELKTPMTAIIGYADLLRMQRLTEKEQQEAYQFIYSESKRLQNLSLKLLDLLVVKKKEFILVVCDMQEILQEVLAQMKTVWKERQIEVTLEGNRCMCKAEPDLIKSMLLNLLDNAQKAIEKEGYIRVECQADKEQCEIRITDSGKGMPESELHKITEAFYRVDKSRSRMQGGAGLGLSLCQEIIRLHRGSIEFISQEGKGTTVIVRLEREGGGK